METDRTLLPPLYLITDRKETLGRPLPDVIRHALEGGVRLIQLREKDLSSRKLVELAGELRAITNEYGARFLINDRVDIALAVGADGVHLGRQSMSVKAARQAFAFSSLVPRPSSTIIGLSTHSLKEALQAESDGADFITFGPVYFTQSKAVYGGPLGIDKLKEVIEAVDIPVFALGGINNNGIAEVLDTGSYGVAMISAIMAAENVKETVEGILSKRGNVKPPLLARGD